MANEKFTKRDALTKIAEGEITDEVIEWAKSEIEKLDASNAKARERKAAKAEENAPLIEDLKALLTDEFKPASDFAEATGLSTAKISALFRKMKETGDVRVDKIKSKKGKVNGYATPTATEDAAPEEDWG